MFEYTIPEIIKNPVVVFENQENPMLIGATLVWKKAPHNAFPDLIFYQDALYCSFRESNQHEGGEDGSVRILKSEDGGQSWTSIAVLQKEGVDLRDPKFSRMPDGRLMLLMVGSHYVGEKYISRSPEVSFSTDGTSWTPLLDLKMPGEWIWDLKWSEGVGYGISYRQIDENDASKPWVLTLLKTKDGIHFEKVTELNVPNYPSEGSLHFLADQTLVVLVRRKGHGWIGTASFPYTEWSWNEGPYRLGGPNFIVLPTGKMWMASRFYKGDGKELQTYTAVGKMTLTTFSPEIILPSSGDTGYPGLVYRNGILYVAYYSSHEGKASIYLAKVRL